MKTGINIQRCNIGSSEMHNTRDAAYIAAVNASPNKHYSIFNDRTKDNKHTAVTYLNDHTLKDCMDVLRRRYKEKTGQAPQEADRIREVTDKKTGLKRTITIAGWSPIREGVCPVKPETTIEDFFPFLAWIKSKGLRCLTLDIHHDEGYEDPETKERHYNHHAHLVIDWTDHETGKTIKLSKDDMSEMQTQLAASLGMERGEAKEATQREHLSVKEQRLVSAEKRAAEAEKRAIVAENRADKAEKRAAEAENRADKAEEHAAEAEKHAKEAALDLAQISYWHYDCFFTDAKRLMNAMLDVSPDQALNKTEKELLVKAEELEGYKKEARTIQDYKKATDATCAATKAIIECAQRRYDELHENKKDQTDKQLDVAIAASFYKQTPAEQMISRILTSSGPDLFRGSSTTTGKTKAQREYEMKQQAEAEQAVWNYQHRR